MNDDQHPVDELLMRTLYGWGCPTSDELGDYSMNLVADDRRRAEIEAHVSACPRCQRELRDLKDFEDENPLVLAIPAADPLLHVIAGGGTRQRKLLHLEYPTLVRASGDALRGLYELGMSVFETDSLTVFLQTRMEGVQLYVEGSVIQPADPDAWIDSLVEVRSGDVIQATAVVGSDLRFVFALTTRAAFDLRIASLKGARIMIMNVQ